MLGVERGGSINNKLARGYSELISGYRAQNKAPVSETGKAAICYLTTEGNVR